jgi:hypothetical protein
MALARIRQTPDGRATVEMTPRRTRLSLLALLALAVAGALAAVASSSLWLRIFCGAAALFFGAMLLIGLPNLFRRGDTTLLTIGDQGLETPRSGLIPWSEIEEVGQTRIVGQSAIGIWTKDPYFAARHGPWYLWPFALFNRRFREPALSFPEKVVPAAELLAELERYWQGSGATLEQVETTQATSSAG